MLGADPRVVESGRDRHGLLDLADLVLHEVAAHPVHHPGHTAADRSAAGRFDTDESSAGLVDEPAEDPHRVRATSDARHHDVGHRTGHVGDLDPGLIADDRLELAHHVRVRVRADDRPEAEVRVGHVGHPVTHRLVDGVLERAAPTVHGLDLGAEQLHAEHVEFLAFDVDRPHVDLALQAHERRGGGAGDAVLAGAGVGHDALLAHPLGEQRLADDVVDLVRAGVVEVLALEDQADAESGRRGCGTRS